MNCDLDGNIPCLGYLMYLIEHDYKHNSITLDEVRFILNGYFGIKMYSLIPKLVHSTLECSDFNVADTYNHIMNCNYQNRMTEPVPGDYLLTPSTDYADALADYIAYLVSFVKLVTPHKHYNPRRRDHFTHRHFKDDH